jgi:hypothetical protein
MPRIVFADNDIILKLAEYDVLPDMCSLLGVDSTKVKVLDPAKHIYARLKKRLEAGQNVQRSLQGLDRAIEFAEAATQLTDKADIDWTENRDSIDVGEAQLASWVVESDDGTCLLTSDKRFLKALAQADAGEHIFRGLYGRVICLEEIIKALIAELGFDHVRSRVASAPECDTGMQLVFGSRFDLPHEQVMEGIESMLRDVASVVGNGWLMRLD